MKNCKFKVGDKVICCNADEYPNDKIYGEITNINFKRKSSADNNPFMYEVVEDTVKGPIMHWSECYITLQSKLSQILK